MNLKYNHYQVTLEHIHNPKGDELHSPIRLQFDNHDNIFNIIEILRERNLFDDRNQATEFAIGLKMFSEVMLRNREHELFKELAPAFKEFMNTLKKGS